MRKILLVLVSILLLAGVAQASEWTSGLNAELSAQNTGHNVVTANSVLFRVYYVGTGLNPSFGVSADSVNLYDDGAVDTTVNTAAAATDTVAEIVASINTDGDWVAVAGPDSYNDYSVAGALIALNNSYTIGSGLDTAGGFTLDSSTPTQITCGVAADATSRIRLKNIVTRIDPTTVATAGSITYDVYDGNTLIWRRIIGPGTYLGTTPCVNSSADTVIPTNDDKGLSTTKGNSLCVIVDTNGTMAASLAVTNALQQVSITYDKLRD